MAAQLELNPRDRVLVVAPHPDDESIGAGGMLQLARARGAALRVLILTDGDNNPWPQRWIEKRWRIGTAERRRWGARRREEARAALQLLGVAPEAVEFFGLPDLGLTPLLLHGDGALDLRLRRTLAEFAPSVIVFPALTDRHPDHNAAHVLLRLALGAGAQLRLLTFAVHGGAAARGDVGVALDADARAAKRAAIEAHTTQMVFGRRRFLAFASAEERFQQVAAVAEPDAAHPLQAQLAAGTLSVRLDRKRWAGGWHGMRLSLVFDGAKPLRLALDLGADGEKPLRDADGAPLGASAWQRTDAAALHLSVPLPGGGPWRQGFVKLARPEPGWRVFDRCGWQAIET